jgi:hypothetical protein
MRSAAASLPAVISTFSQFAGAFSLSAPVSIC